MHNAFRSVAGIVINLMVDVGAGLLTLGLAQYHGQPIEARSAVIRQVLALL